ncbi:MAG: FecR family protein, partial [Chloroflexota bacterium]|nr:FecR family protein [Chloroflexota bacterium]
MTQLLQLYKKILLTSLCVPVLANIGNITEHKGSGQLIRQAGTFNTNLAFGIESFDDIRTANGRLAITFDDDTSLRLTEHSKIIIDEFVYDANPSNSKMAITFAQGTARFATGALGRVPKENIFIRTPTASIAIRGTDFTTTVDELGRSLVILLPDSITGEASGEITVTNAGGTVTLNQAYQATMVSTSETQASQPVTLDIDLNLIDNMFIVTPPPVVQETVQETAQADDSVLDFDALEFN